MKTTRSSVACLIALGLGCGSSPDGPPAPAAPRVAWSPTLIADGSMFRDEKAFRSYVARAEIVATGILDSWDG